ncbi:MAG TPA: hypothetical protein VL977_01725 [Solirubrobacteraceae bacterium]|nr:hypothetical protein [Solirubrobacteraceae bacterium]
MTARIAVDIDSTLHHYWDTLTEVCRVELGVELADAERFARGDAGICESELERAVAISQTDPYILAAEPYPDAIEVIAGWRRAGCAIHIATHRPPRARPATAAWLARIGLEYDELDCSSDKIEHCVAGGIGILIDDQPDNLERALAAGLRAAALRHPWNRELCARLPVLAADSWRELGAVLAPLLAGQ